MYKKRLLLLMLGLTGLMILQSGCTQPQKNSESQMVEAKVLQSKLPQDPKIQEKHQPDVDALKLIARQVPASIRSYKKEEIVEKVEVIEKQKRDSGNTEPLILDLPEVEVKQIDIQENCMAMGFIVQSECMLCEEISGAVCVEVQKDSGGVQCYECREKEQLCHELGLIEFDECVFCKDIPGAECQLDKVAKQGRQCYTCIQKLKKCEDIGFIGSAECQKCRSAPNMECRSAESSLSQNCFECVEIDLGEHELELDSQTSKEIVKEEFVLPISLNEFELGVEGFVGDNEQKERGSEVEKLIQEVKRIEIIQEIVDKENEMPILVSIEKIEREEVVQEIKSDENGSFLPVLENFVEGAENGKQICEDVGLYSLDRCEEEKCLNCVFAKKVNRDELCYLCQVSEEANECLNNGHYNNCDQCRPQETCSPISVIVFEGKNKSPTMRCYDCLPGV